MNTIDSEIIVGNCAKYFVQKQISAKLKERIANGRSTTLVDMGCGDASKWSWLANEAYSRQLKFVGFDPDGAAIQKARARFPQWTFVAAPAYAMKNMVESADIVVSFSALEHVYKRRDFIRAARSIMAPESVFYLNYDNGHFLTRSEWKGNIFGPILARLGIERYYQSFVWQEEIERILLDSSFRVIEELNFHQATSKAFQRAFSNSDTMKPYMEAWLDFELKVNALVQSDPVVQLQANSNEYHLSKLFVLVTESSASGR